MPTAGSQFVCKACGKALSSQVIASARKGHAARCECGASVRVSAVPAARAQAGESAYGVTDDPAAGAARAAKPSGRSGAKPLAVPGLEEDSYRCPACNAAMAPGTVLCIGCGFNLNTGQRLAPPGRGGTKTSAGPSPTARRAASAFGVPAPHRAAQVKEDRSGQIGQIVLAVGGMLLLLAVVGGGRFLWNHFHQPVNYVGDDGRVAELMDNSGFTEIHAWFTADPSRMAGGLSTTQALALADSLQKMGAKQVLAFGSRMTRTLGVELPNDASQRKALFEWYNARYVEPGGKPMIDQGQHYLLLGLGL